MNGPEEAPAPSAAISVSAVIPIYNEEENLDELDAELRAVLCGLDRACEILYVDDRSTDGSRDRLRALVAQHAGHAVRTRLVLLRRNFGQTAALAAGFEQAEGEIVVALDGDGQNDPKEIPKLIETLEGGCDVASGWRRDRFDHWARVVPSRVANRLISSISKVDLHDHGCTLKAYRGDLLRELHLYGEMHRFIPVYLARQGARVVEVEVSHRPRRKGVSKYGSDRIFKVLLDLVLILFMSRYFTRPMHFFGQAAILFAGLFVAVGGLMTIFKLGLLPLIGIDYQADFVQTPLPALAGTLFASAVLSLFFGVLGEILIRAYFELQGLRPFVVQAIESSEGGEPLKRDGD
ncbi:MAG: glycosyltransferase family 2 protein [Acidobacteriota bacterium]